MYPNNTSYRNTPDALMTHTLDRMHSCGQNAGQFLAAEATSPPGDPCNSHRKGSIAWGLISRCLANGVSGRASFSSAPAIACRELPYRQERKSRPNHTERGRGDCSWERYSSC